MELIKQKKMEQLELALAALYEFSEEWKKALSWDDKSLLNKSINNAEELLYKLRLEVEIKLNQTRLHRTEFPEIKQEIKQNLKEALEDKKHYDLVKKAQILN